MKYRLPGAILCGVCLLGGLAGCRRGTAPPPAEPAPASSAQPAPPPDPERQLADALAEMWARVQELQGLERQMRDYAADSAHRRERAHFLQRFYEIVDADKSGPPTWASQVRTLQHILSAHQPALAGRLERGEFRSLLHSLLSDPADGPLDRGDGSAAPFPDKSAACADYCAAWVAQFGDLHRRRQELRKGLDEKTGPEVERQMVAVLKVHPDAWLAGEGPEDLDIPGRVHEVLRKHHPEIADALTGMMKQRLADSVKSCQDEVKRRLAEIADAERRFRDLDLDGNGVADFWTGDVSGLFRFQIGGEPIELIPAPVAAADGAALPAGGPLGAPMPRPDSAALVNLPPEARPSCFGFRAVPQDAVGKPLAADANDPGRRWRDREHFAFCAYPLRYGAVGRQTFLITQEGQIWFTDTKGKPVERLPHDPEAEGWTNAGETDTGRPRGPAAFDRLPLAFLLKQLQSADAATRSQAVEALGERTAPSQPTQPARKVDLEEGGYCIEPERKPLTADALQALLHALDDPDHEVRRSAVGAVQHVGYEAVPAAVARLKQCLEGAGSAAAGQDQQKMSDRRLDAIEGLVQLAPEIPELPPLLAGCLSDPSPETRRTAAARLGDLGPRAAPAADALTKALEDQDASVREAVTAALSRIRGQAIPANP